MTANTLTLTNIQLTDAGAYIVAVSNLWGGEVSATATLTFNAPAANSYASYVVADKPAAYWRLNETNGPTIQDSIGGFDGTCYSAAPSTMVLPSRWASRPVE